jgi:hypothetical protein
VNLTITTNLVPRVGMCGVTPPFFRALSYSAREQFYFHYIYFVLVSRRTLLNLNYDIFPHLFTILSLTKHICCINVCSRMCVSAPLPAFTRLAPTVC